VPNIDPTVGAAAVVAAMSFLAVPLWAEASTAGVKPWVSTVGYGLAWSANYISTLEHGRNVCADTTNGAGTIAAKVAIVAVSALMTLSELREDLEPARKPRPAPKSAPRPKPAPAPGGFI
jgi:hypothetical protein